MLCRTYDKSWRSLTNCGQEYWSNLSSTGKVSKNGRAREVGDAVYGCGNMCSWSFTTIQGSSDKLLGSVNFWMMQFTSTSFDITLYIWEICWKNSMHVHRNINIGSNYGSQGQSQFVLNGCTRRWFLSISLRILLHIEWRFGCRSHELWPGCFFRTTYTGN